MKRQYAYDLDLHPREVPFSVRYQLMFGGFFNQFGWFFLGFGLVFFWIFTLNAEFSSLYYFRGELETAPGTVLVTEPTSFSEGGSKHSRGRRIYAMHYSFSPLGEGEYGGTSYATGERFRKGDSVTVEYPKGNPSVSRIQGMRRAILSSWAALVGIFPLVGGGFIIAGLRNGIKANRLLANGKVGVGVLKSKVPTNTRINNQTVYKLTFEFAAEDGMTYEVITRTHIPSRLQDEKKERLLYDSFRPSYAVMLDNLPGSPTIDERGEIHAERWGKALLVLIVPFLSIAGHSAYVCWRFF